MLKGFSTQKKENSLISGFTDKQSQDTSEYATLQKTSSDKVLLDTVNSSVFRLHNIVKTAEADSTDRVLISTAHGAEAGDLVRFELFSANPYFESKILSVPDADTIVLAAKLPISIGTGDEFYLLRHAAQRVDETGAGIVSVSQGPTQFIYDGAPTEVEQDTITPSDSRPLPVINLKNDGTVVDFATSAKQDAQTTLLNEISTNTLALRFLTNTAGSLSQQSLTGTSASTISVPANAVSCNIQAPSTNEQNIRVSIGSTASTSAGMLFEPGRSEVFSGAAAISACATVAGSNEVIVQWVLRS